MPGAGGVPPTHLRAGILGVGHTVANVTDDARHDLACIPGLRSMGGTMRGEARIQIKAPPEHVWGMVADVTRMGEWSPECVRCEWLGGATGPVAGARFRGDNRRGPRRWSMVSTVTAAEPGREFAFVVNRTGATWRYRLAPLRDGTELTESYDVPPGPIRRRVFYKVMGRQRALDVGIHRTLERIKAAAEAG
jgi:hypothetical protein